jgi:tetratricopeptide (TPR) repeat protein
MVLSNIPLKVEMNKGKMKQDFLEEDEQILYKPQKNAKDFLLVSFFSFGYILFTLLGIWISSILLRVNVVLFVSLFIVSFCGFVIGIWAFFGNIFDFLFMKIYITNEKILLSKIFPSKIRTIKFEDIESIYRSTLSNIVVKEKNHKSTGLRLIKDPQTLIDKIFEQSPNAKLPDNYEKMKQGIEVLNFIFLLGMSTPFIIIYFILLFHTGNIKAFYYECTGNKYIPKCHSIEECKNARKSLHYNKNLEFANEYYLKALKYTPENYHLYSKIADTYTELKQYDAAVSILKTELLFRPQNSRIIYFEIGELYEKNKNYDLAVESLKKSSTIKQKDGFSDDVFINMHLAYIYKKLGKEKQAKLYADKIKNIKFPPKI